MDETFSSEQQAMVLLCFLPPSSKHFCEVRIYGHGSLKIDYAKSSLLNCGKTKHDSGICNGVTFGFVARDN